MTAGSRAFDAWLDDPAKAVFEVADKLGIAVNTVYNLRYGQRPSLRLACRIAALTEGAVSVESWEEP